MHRCLIPAECWAGVRVELNPKVRHYLLDVLRLAERDEVRAFDGVGREAVVRLVVAGEEAYGEILRELTSERQACELILYQAIPKQRRMELVVEKGTELGVTRIVPMVTERTIVRPDAKQAAMKRERWVRIAESAARQCGRASVPEITPVAMSMQEALLSVPTPDMLLVGVIQPDTEPFKELLAEAEAKGVRSIGMVVGPEGDLTPSEVAVVCVAGGRAVSFGPQVLRVETAALFALSVFSHRLVW